MSIGITMICQDSEDPGTLVKYADLAIYRAKEKAQCLSVLHFRPKVGLKTPRAIAVEALLRWHLEFLECAGCAQCQGNLFSYPLSEDALIGFLIRQYESPLIS